MKRLDINAIKGVNMKIDEKDLELDLYKLDEGWLDLPLLSLKWSQKLVETEMDTRNLKIKVEQLRATIDGKMRENPGEYGIQKITEGTITAAITIHPAVVEALQECNDKDRESKEVKAMCLAIEAKRKALEGLTQLYSTGYFANKPILANPGYEMTQEKETAKLNTESNKKLLRKKV
jgi:hypothetical protein